MRIWLWALVCRLVLIFGIGVSGLSFFAIALQFPILVTVPVGVITYRRLTRWRGSGDAFGTARSSDAADLLSKGLIGSDAGLIMGTAGYVEPPSKADGLAALFNPAMHSDLACRQFFGSFGSSLGGESYVRIPDYVHLITCAPAGSGKTTYVLGPNLLNHRGPMVVIDPKGELHGLTAEHRRRKFGHRIVRLDPFNVCGPGGDALNPFDFLPDASAPDFLDAVRDLANMLVVRQGTETDPAGGTVFAEPRESNGFMYGCGFCDPDGHRWNVLFMDASKLPK